MTRARASLPAAVAVSLALTACGAAEDDPAAEAAVAAAMRGLPAEALAAQGVDAQAQGGAALVGLRLDAGAVTAGGALTGTVSAGEGAVVYLGFPKAVFAGPRFVRIPRGQRAARFVLHSNPFLPAATAATITARTQSPDPASYVEQVVPVAPQSPRPAGEAPQVAAATLLPATVASGAATTLALTLTRPAPAEGAAILLAISNDFFFRDADLPPVVVVPAGATRLDVPVRAHLSSPTATAVSELVVANAFGGPFQGGVLLVTAR